MPNCKGLAGLLFGHKYRPRYSLGAPAIAEIRGMSSLSDPVDYVELVEASKAETYECDVCERCGGIAEKGGA